jgi:hypothetical protein
MIINAGLILNESQISVKSLNKEDNSIESKTIPFTDLNKENFNILFYADIEKLESVAQNLQSEETYYPIVDISSVDLQTSDFENSNFNDLLNAFEKINTRWVLSNNIQTIETLCAKASSLKNLWVKDRNDFFKTLWTIFKSNLAATELTILFNDLKEPTEAAMEKGEKPTLCHSYIKGKKIAELHPGGDPEKALMKEYAGEFNSSFNITEFNVDQGQLVICSSLEKSPILFMACVPSLNQLQRSVLSGIMNGLQTD